MFFSFSLMNVILRDLKDQIAPDQVPPIRDFGDLLQIQNQVRVWRLFFPARTIFAMSMEYSDILSLKLE
jgi:hypothetical protein